MTNYAAHEEWRREFYKRLPDMLPGDQRIAIPEWARLWQAIDDYVRGKRVPLVELGDAVLTYGDACFKLGRRANEPVPGKPTANLSPVPVPGKTED